MKPVLLDANILSELWKPNPDRNVLAFMQQVDWYLPSPVIAEIQEGAEAAPSQARRAAINGRLDAFLSEFGLLVVDWDAETSRVWGRLKHSPEVKRQPQSLWDSLIDAMGVRFNMEVATRNPRDFRHTKTVNPFQPGSAAE